VYFNSVAFNGEQFLSSEAEKAGYSRARRRPDKSIVEFGIASVVEQDFAQTSETVEDTLLRTLVADAHARQTARYFLDSRPSFTDHDIVWSHPNKKWLFDKLVYTDIIAPPDEKVKEARCRLLQIDDVPLNAFDTDQSTSGDEIFEDVIDGKNSGNLEHLFGADFATQVMDDCFDFRITEDKHDLLVQESLSKLLWVSASLRVESLRDKLRASPLCLTDDSKNDETTVLPNETDDETEPSVSVSPESSIVELPIQGNATKHSLTLVASLRDALNTATALKESSNRITVTVMDQSFSTGVGRNSLSVRQRLVDEVADHVQNDVTFLIPSMDCSDSEGDNPFQVMEHDEPFEEGLERIAEEWGDWLDDDYVWSSSDSESSRLKAMAAFHADNEDKEEAKIEDFEEESLEDFNARIEKEYKAWIET
jgi:hypothetical protein